MMKNYRSNILGLACGLGAAAVLAGSMLAQEEPITRVRPARMCAIAVRRFRRRKRSSSGAPALTEVEFERANKIYFKRCAGCHGYCAREPPASR